MDAANAIGETNDLHAAKHWLTIFISGESKDIFQQKSNTIDLAIVDLLTENVKIQM